MAAFMVGKSLKDKRQQKAIEELFDKADYNKNGRISIHEYADLFRFVSSNNYNLSLFQFHNDNIKERCKYIASNDKRVPYKSNHGNLWASSKWQLLYLVDVSLKDKCQQKASFLTSQIITRTDGSMNMQTCSGLYQQTIINFTFCKNQ